MSLKTSARTSGQHRIWQKISLIGGCMLIGCVLGFSLSVQSSQSSDRAYVQAQSKYHEFSSLNQNPTDVDSSWTKLTTTTSDHTFTKISNESTIEVHVNSRFSINELNANGILIQIRIDDDITADVENWGSLLRANTSDFQSFFAAFEGLEAGEHTVSLWAQAIPDGTATGIFVDPGGWGGSILVKEAD